MERVNNKQQKKTLNVINLQKKQTSQVKILYNIKP